MHERTLAVTGPILFEKIQKTAILLIGLGGVGGYAFESLIRTGFQKITIVDYDKFELTNLNRQILATKETIGKSKCSSAFLRKQAINTNIELEIIERKLIKEDITVEFLNDFDFIIDACDTIDVKVELINKCNFLNKRIISCMGTANRTHPELLKITTLDKTYNDPLSKKVRTSVEINKKTPVVWSEEFPLKQKELGTICSVPMCAGALLVSYVVNELKNNTNF